MIAIPSIETERLLLRGPQESDFPLYQAFYADADGSGHYGGPRLPFEAWKVLAADIGHWVMQGFGKWMMVRKSDQATLGGCGIVHPGGWPSHELTWWLMPEFRGSGYATEASRAVIRFARETLGWPTVETHMRDTNAPAIALTERLGGRIVRREVFPDGISRNIYVFSGDEGRS